MQMTRRAMLATTAAAVTLAACQRQAAAPDLNAVLDRLVTNILRDSPEYATALGVPEAQAGGPYMARSSDLSRAGLEATRAISQTGLNELRALDRERLSDADKVTFDVVTTSLENGLNSSRFGRGANATNPYVLSQINGAFYNVPDFLASVHPVTDRAQADAYLTRLSGLARQMDQELERFAEDTGAGVIPPDFAIDRCLEQLRAFAGTAPAQSVLVTAFAQKLGGVEAIAAADRTALTQRAETVLRDEVLPAYQRQIDALVAIRPRSVHDAGIWQRPQGAEMYQASLVDQTTTSMTPDEIHRMGVDLVTQHQAEMDAILRAQGMTRGSVAERVQALYRRPDQLYPNTDAGRAQLLSDLNELTERVRARMPEVFGRQARAPLEIVRVPEYTQAGAPGGYYNPASLDGSRPGRYYINLRNTAEVPRFTLPTLTYHEGIPGHHWQIALQQESQEIPFIRSALLGFNAYAEGWALYSEQLADELGLYAEDPFGRLGYLQSAVFRASRLVVDTGMHHLRWSREQAIDSMMAATGDARSNVVTEIERYAVWPGQATGYMVGKQAIIRMRAAQQQALGDRFDLRGFHDAVLANGSVPLSVLEGIVGQWAATRAA